MSITPSPSTPPTPSAYPPNIPPPEGQEVRIVSHSNIFYWWPVWAFGFLMVIITYADRALMVTVPPGSKVVANLEVPVEKVELSNQEKKDSSPTKVKRDAIILPAGQHEPLENPSNPDSRPVQPYIHMARHQTPGVFFITILLLVIVITNVPLRGMWSLIVIISIVTLGLILYLANLTDVIKTYLSYLDIRINLAGYFFFSTVLFIIWFTTVVFFDKRIYIVFGARQLRVCTEIGSGEKVYDAMGLALEKQPSDWFRHWLLGMGAGDLVVKTSGAQAHTFDLPNVLFIRAKIRAIERLMQRQVVQAR